MPRWNNWSGRLRADPDHIAFVRSEADAAATITAASRRGLNVRTGGAFHSHAPLLVTDGVLVDVSGLSGVITTDIDRRRAWIWAGTPIYALGRPLHDAGLALHNQGDIDRQALAGAIGTGTHGTGSSLASLSAAVTGARIVLASGDVVECSANSEPDLWEVARLHLGAAGIVTRVELALRDAYRLREQGWSEPFDALLPKIPALAAENRHFEFFWFPHNDAAVAKTINETDEPAEYPLAEEGSRCAWSYEVLPNAREQRHTEMEYSIPADQGLECLSAIRELIRSRFRDVHWPVEYRHLAKDDVWLSTAYGRATVTISVHQDVDLDEAPYFQACEEVFRSFDGRPHWGKVHYLQPNVLAAIHPRWQDWWRVRDAFDPEGRFLNDYLSAWRPR
ncbi:MAG: FAD-binding protein [Pseudomonadales bacterium]|nr:FAD-binding protein [Pseudomonadales bacterium]NIX08898.1 FAD-binding protein [Pseudomonadales bacterium]